MEMTMLAGALLHPLALAVLSVVVLLSVRLAASPLLTKAQLWRGLLGLTVVGLVLAFSVAYVSPEQSRSLGVAEDRYWSVLSQEFMVLTVLILYIGLLGVSLVGIPIAVLLAKRQYATVPLFVVASVIASVVGLVVLWLFFEGKHLGAKGSAQLTLGHAFLAFGFAVGSGLPWTARNQPHEA
jgi:hypothetical protein